MSTKAGYDFVTERDAVREFRDAMRHFFLNPKQWRSFHTTHTLVWEKCRFTRANRKCIPKVPGVYAFIIEHADHGLPPHGYILYFGITGFSADRHLWARYGDYLREKRKGPRFLVQAMLNDYEDDLFFHFVRLPVSFRELKTLETALLDAFLPPVNERDFSAVISRRRRALR